VIPQNRPVVVVIAGPNGAGKSTFYEAFLAASGLRFVNADVIARELELDAYSAAKIAARIREELVDRGESFIFETVLSDPVGDKVEQLAQWQSKGYTVVLCFIGLSEAAISDERVAMRVSQGGHDVPPDKIIERFPRVLANLKLAIERLSHVRVYDNSDLRNSYRLLAVFENGVAVDRDHAPPAWFANMAPPVPKLDAPKKQKPRRR
jgi:predicted ABC-type ATPase